MNSEEKVDQHSLWQDLIEQSRESHRKQEQLFRKVVTTLPVNLDLGSETLWLLQEADNAVRKAYAINEPFVVGSKIAADVLSLLSDLEKTIPENLRKIRGNILDTGDAESKQIDTESLRNMKKATANLFKDFGGRRGPYDTEPVRKAKHLRWDKEQCRWKNGNAGEDGDELDFEEDKVRSEIALKIITSPIHDDWTWDRERNRWSPYSEEKGRRYFKGWFAEGTFKKILREELEDMVLLYWVASRSDSMMRAAYTQTQIAKLLGWSERDSYKVSRCVKIIKTTINILIPLHSDYKKYLAS